MDSKSFSLVLQIILLTEILTGVLCKEDFQEHLRKRRGIKDALPKDDDFSQARTINEMRHKVLSLENSVKGINSEIDKMASQNNQLQESVLQQKALLEKLDGDFDSIKEVLSGHANALGDLEKLANTDENLFALSNQTCGGVLVGQSGSIVFTSMALRGTRFPSTCIWTIRANNRGTIKITTNAYRGYTYTRSNAYVVEILNKNDTNSTSNATGLQTKITRLERNMHHVCQGPVVFVVYLLTSYVQDEYADVDLHLHYQGMGKLRGKNIHYSHESLHEQSGNFSNNQIESWRNSEVTDLDNSNNITYFLDYTSIVISNFSTKVHLQAIFENGRCGDRDTSFIVITDLLESKSVAFIDCCQQSCDGKNSLINYDNPFIILIIKKYKVPLKFNINWEAEKAYPASSRIEPGNAYGHKCGEVLGGVSGTILYKPHVSYRNGERCIWTIVPQPRPRSAITISVGANGVESTYDHLYMLELTDVNGTELASAPKITPLGRYGSYEARSREVYIVFYSDSSVTGYGFSLSWKSTGELVTTGLDVTTRFTILKDDEGSATSMQERPILTNSIYQVFLLTPVVPTTYTFGMQLHINQTHPTPTPNGCLHEDISIFTAIDGILRKPDMSIESTEAGKIAIDDADGLVMIVVNDKEPDTHVEMSFNWREEYGEGNASHVSVNNNGCGGVIKGDKGVLKYKIGVDYLNNERCVWLLQAPNRTSITLKLLKDGFEACCDNILVNTIDPTNGTLRNDTTIINRANRTRTFNESVLVIVFRSDTSTRGRGFALQFSSSGEANASPEYRYQLRHHNEPFGAVVYPSSDWEESTPGIKDILVIASSIKIGVDEDPFSMPTNISWTSGHFKKESSESCDYESITFYTTPAPEGWLKRERFPNENDTASCTDVITVDKKTDICSTVYSAFVVIYRHVPSAEDDEDGGAMKMGFTFEESAGCGGVIIGDAGEISYKETGRYSNSEKCIWLVHAPQASKIRFYLERSGFEACCDLIYVQTLNNDGIPVPGSIIQAGNRTAVVNGPVAIVVFTSDSSVTGDGFRLTFSTAVIANESFPYTYHLEHRNQPIENTFKFPVESNELVIAAFSPELHRQTTDTVRISSTQVRVASMRPQVNESCQSDTLTLYDVFWSDRGLVASKQYSAADVSGSNFSPESGNCTVAGLNGLTELLNSCDNIEDCGDAPADNILKMNTTSFVAIYKSVNTSIEQYDLPFRGVVMVSETTYNTSLMSSS